MTREQLIAWRKSLRMSQSEMAEYLGYSLSGYRKIEQQNGNPVNKQLLRTIEILRFVEQFAPEIADALKK